ncbi:unnamed protein product [Parnassius apollo]|uniref:(apollo) hypothetical protein n=1 Tax=Parnassius apollo TaxID=110799 RepID=A0A8S3XMY3_PARAO|nr:unnamed protein product [Parnassius apollo]
MDIIIRVNNQSVGRDKLARLVQYTSRLVWHQLETRNANKYSVDRVKSLENTLGTFRKVLRLGRCIDIFYTAFNNIHIEDPFLRFTLTTSKLAHALYLYADHIVWLSKSGFLRSDSDGWSQTANRFWLLSIIANLARDFYEILHVLDAARDALPSSELLLRAQFEDCREQESVSRRVLVEKPIYSTSNYAELLAQFNKCEEQKSVSHIVREETPVCSYQPHVTEVRSNNLFIAKYLERNLSAAHLTLLRINSLK